jgi:hypothetical protein
MSIGVLIREEGDDLPVGKEIVLVDGEADPHNTIHSSIGKTIGCSPEPTADELNQIVLDELPDAIRRGRAIVINSNVKIPAECIGGVTAYQDAVGIRPWTAFLIRE